MAVLKAKPAKIVEFFLELLSRDLNVASIVTRVSDEFFKGTEGDTVTLRVNGLRATARDYEWRTRNNPIILDDIRGGGGVPVKLDTHLYSATGLTDEHLTLDDINFAREVLRPQAAAVGQRMEGKVVAAFTNEPWSRSFSVSVEQDPLRVALEARRLLDADKVAPAGGRFFLLGSNVEAAWLASDRLSKYESTGQGGTPALREAIVGRIAGAPVITSSLIPADYAGLHHASALVLGVVAPEVPGGVSAGSRISSPNGLAVRWIRDYDAAYLRDRSIVSSFMGLTGIRDQRYADGDATIPAGYSAGDLVPTENPDGTPNAAYLNKNYRGVRINVTGTGTVLRDTDPAVAGFQP